MSRNRTHEGARRTDAADWLAKADRGLTPQESAAFEGWKRSDPRNEAEYARLAQEWDAMGLAKADPELAALADALDRETKNGLTVRRSCRRLSWSLGLAAAAALLALFVGLGRPSGKVYERTSPALAESGTSYEVVPSAARKLSLEDGSIVELRGESRVEVAFTETERRVTLVQGEAYFSVAKNPRRPFVVDAGKVAVRAVGTAFNVRMGTGSVEVLVTEGKVRVAAPLAEASPVREDSRDSAPLVAAGERLQVTLGPSEGPANLELGKVPSAEIEQMLAWQNPRLVFNRTPLAEAVEAFNRYGSARIELGDAALREHLLGGTFRANNAEGFVRLLEQGDGISAERRPDGVIVLRAGQ